MEIVPLFLPLFYIMRIDMSTRAVSVDIVAIFLVGECPGVTSGCSLQK
jgi:hypothetical protein